MAWDPASQAPSSLDARRRCRRGQHLPAGPPLQRRWRMFPPCRLCRYSSQPPPPLLPARDPPEQGPLQTPVGSSRRSANLRRQHLRAERRRFARRSRAMRDGETTLDLDLEWGEGMSGRVDGPIWTQPAGLGSRAGRDQSSLSFFLLLIFLTEQGTRCQDSSVANHQSVVGLLF